LLDRETLSDADKRMLAELTAEKEKRGH
jgi:hypothetical protein